MRTTSVWALLILMILAGVALPAAAREIHFEADFIGMEKSGDEEIITLIAFKGFVDDYMVEGETGRLYRQTEVFAATGSVQRPVLVVKSGDDAFEMTATEEMTIDFSGETMHARGDVVYRSDDTESRSQVLAIDVRDAVAAMVAPLLQEIPAGERRSVIEAFFARALPEDRLVFLQGDVAIMREDTSLKAAWVLFNENSPDDMISVAAPEQKIELRITSDD